MMEELEKLKTELIPATMEAMRVDNYTYTYNPDYGHAQELYDDAAREIASMEGVASVEEIDAELVLRGQMARGDIGDVIITTGSCEREIAMEDDPDTQTEQVVNEIRAQESIVLEELSNAHHVSRDINQHYKPRSDEHERGENGEYKTDEDGKKIPSFYGSGINGESENDRTPDPSRAVAGALFSRDICEHYMLRTGKNITSSHEALLLLLEENSIREHAGLNYLNSAVVPWVGNRTRQKGSPQLELLGSVENPVAVKIDSTTNEEDIKMQYETLNPDQIDGKVTFILRLGVSSLAKAEDIVGYIQKYAPLSLIASDPLHANTKNVMVDGEKRKTRELPDAEAEMLAVAKACKNNGTRLHQLHLEANGRSDVEECVDQKGGQPKDSSRVDPCLNNRQLRRLIRYFRENCV